MDSINLNGIEYVKKQQLDELRESIESDYIKKECIPQQYVSKEDLDEFKAKMRKSLLDLTTLMGVESPQVEQPSIIEVKKPETKPETPAPKRVLKRTKPFGGTVTPRSRDNRIFVPSKSSSVDLDIVGVDEDGHFKKSNGWKTTFTIDEVKFLKDHVNKRTTFKDIRIYAKHIGLSTEMTRQVVYNLNNHVFDRFI